MSRSQGASHRSEKSYRVRGMSAANDAFLLQEDVCDRAHEGRRALRLVRLIAEPAQRVRRHRQRAAFADGFEQAIDYSLRPAFDVTKVRKRRVRHYNVT